MELIFLGTGTSQGVPLIAHPNPGLDTAHPRNWRSRTSVHVVMDGFHIQVDAAPEFRLQCLQNDIRALDLFILTHGHADHVMGMDDLRRFVDLRQGEALPVYSTEEGLRRVQSIYPYAIRERPEFKGYPAFATREMPPLLEMPAGRITSTLLPHGRVDVLGLVFQERSSGRKLAYFTDCKEVTPKARELAAGAEVVVLDALRWDPHPTHLTVDEALQVAQELGAPQTYFTHLTNQIDYVRDSAKLPPGVAFAYDGLRVDI